MKSAFAVFFSIGIVICLSSCKTSSPTGPANDTGTPTAEGTPIGAPSIATIDATGGSLSSPDGKLDVIIPPGALSAATQISIQPGTNEAPLGIGSGFSLTPNGQTFSKPITLRFHFAAADLIGTDMNALTVATQKADHIWYAFNDVTLDSAAGTLSITTSHFTWYDVLEYFRVTPESGDIKVSKTLGLRVDFDPLAADTDPADALSPLREPSPYTNPDQVVWSVNGNLQANPGDGTVSPENGSSTTTYTAPSTTQNMNPNPAAVTAIVNIPGNNKFFKTAKKLYLISNVKVSDDKVKTYKISMDLTGTDMVDVTDVSHGYTQHASFSATIYPDRDTVVYGDINNEGGQITGWKERYNTCIHKNTSQGDFMHVSDFYSDFAGQSHPSGNPIRIYPHVVCTNTGISYTTDCGQGPKTTTGSSYTWVYAPGALFILDGTTQTLSDPTASNNGVAVTFTITPE